ncbi:MAG: tyrosine-type recombinase/integrase [Dehalogenimonas sp.]
MIIEHECKSSEASWLCQIVPGNDLVGCFQAFIISGTVEGLSPATLRAYRCLTGEFIKFLRNNGIQYPKDISTSLVRLFLLEKQKTCNPVSVHGYFRHAASFLNWLVKEGILDRSPAATIKPPRIPKILVKPFTVEIIRRLLSMCDVRTFVGARNIAILLMFLDTALRLAELAGIKLSDINFELGIIKVLGKGARERLVRMSRPTEKALLKYLIQRNDCLPQLWLTEERTPLTKGGIAQMIKMLGKRAGIKGVRVSAHTFRHTSATMALENGGHEFEVQAMLGHATLSMTRKYVAAIDSNKAVEAHKRFSPVENLKLGKNLT